MDCLDIARAAGLKSGKEGRNEILFHCPRHDDKHPSLKVNSSKNAWLCGPCGKSGNAWDLAAFLAEFHPGDKKTVTAWLRDKGLVNGNSEAATYDYLNENRTLLFQTVRYEPKDFRQRRPDGNGDWLLELHERGIKHGKRRKIPGIFERGSRWQIDTFYRGFRVRESCATPEMAEVNLRKIETPIDEGRYLEKKREPKETLREFAETYLEWCKDLRQKAYDSKAQRINLVVDRLGKETALSKITRAEIERYQADRLSTPGERKAEVKPATVNREVAALKHMLGKAVEWKVLSENPASGVKMFKETGRRLRFLTPEECDRLLDACSSTMKQVVTLALHTGMRKSEIRNLTWESVNLRERYIELVDQKNGEHSTIPLNQIAIDTLRAIPRRFDSKYVLHGKTPDKPFYDLKRQFESAVKKAGLEGVTFHILRHTTGSHLTMSGVDLRTVQEIPRHKSILMTQRYAHLSPAHKKSAVDALENALSGSVEKPEKHA